MITYLQMKIKQFFCKHRNIEWKEASSIEKRYWLYGRVVCKDCGKVINEVKLFDNGRSNHDDKF